MWHSTWRRCGRSREQRMTGTPRRCPLKSPCFPGRKRMSRFNNLRLAYRLGIAFGAMVLALVVIGAVAVSKMNALDAGVTDLSNHDVVVQQHVLDMQANVQRTTYLATSHLYVHDGELTKQDAVAKEIAALMKEGDVDAKAVKEAND